eukprot:4007242-Prymnesium_polylepis.2
MSCVPATACVCVSIALAAAVAVLRRHRAPRFATPTTAAGARGPTARPALLPHVEAAASRPKSTEASKRCSNCAVASMQSCACVCPRRTVRDNATLDLLLRTTSLHPLLRGAER